MDKTGQMGIASLCSPGFAVKHQQRLTRDGESCGFGCGFGELRLQQCPFSVTSGGSSFPSAGPSAARLPPVAGIAGLWVLGWNSRDTIKTRSSAPSAQPKAFANLPVLFGSPTDRGAGDLIPRPQK